MRRQPEQHVRLVGELNSIQSGKHALRHASKVITNPLQSGDEHNNNFHSLRLPHTNMYKSNDLMLHEINSNHLLTNVLPISDNEVLVQKNTVSRNSSENTMTTPAKTTGNGNLLVQVNHEPLKRLSPKPMPSLFTY